MDKQKIIVLLDMHAILHRSYHALPQFTTKDGIPTGALYGLVTMLASVIKTFEPYHMIGCYDLPSPTHRHEVYDEYKAGRQKTDQALIDQFITSREILTSLSIPYFEIPGFEADDLIGTLSAELSKKTGIETIIASGDKDTLQLLTYPHTSIFTLKKGVKDTVLYTSEVFYDSYGFSCEYLTDFKALSGDSSDNIPGIVGIGEKTATTLIYHFGSIENLYTTLKTNQNALKGIVTERIAKLIIEGKDSAFFSKMLATIRIDAPVEYTIPEKSWIETYSNEDFITICKKFEFKSLINTFSKQPRIEKQQNEYNQGSVKKTTESKKTTTEKKEESQQLRQKETIYLRESIILAWILDSTQTKGTLESVLKAGNSDMLVEAHAHLISRVESDKELLFVWKSIEQPLMRILEKMHRIGIKIDINYIEKLKKQYASELDECKKNIFELSGREFLISSPKQLGEVLYDELNIGSGKKTKKTKGGARSTAEETLLEYKDEHHIIPLILEFRELHKLLHTYLEVLPEYAKENGRVHTTFLQDNTATGRLASFDPNLQNIPIRTEKGAALRDIFIAEEGYILGAFDYSQIELRLAAYLSKEEGLLSEFVSGRDIHTTVASRIFNVPISEVTKTMRSKAKTINFGILYGMGVQALKKNLGGETTLKEAKEYLEAYKESYPNLMKWMNQTIEETRALGYSKTLFGRRRMIPELHSTLPFIRAQGERFAINAPIQGTNADIIKLAMIRIDEYIQKKSLQSEIFLLLQIHDELVFELKKEGAQEYQKEITRIMESLLPEDAKSILKVESSLGRTWGECK